MADKREPIAWITRGGKHIPIFADEPTEDEKKKDREIAENKKQADEKNKKDAFGEPGIYELYRVGKVDFGKKNYRISFAQDEAYASTYKPSHEGMDVETYEVEIRNPLVINLQATKTNDAKGKEGWMQDEQAGTYAAYNKLFGTNYSTKDSGVYEHGAFYDYAKYGSVKARKMLRQRDQEIMDEAVKQGYDAVIYKFDRPGTVRNGVRLSKPDNKNEVLIPAEYKKRIKKKGN